MNVAQLRRILNELLDGKVFYRPMTDEELSSGFDLPRPSYAPPS